MEAKKVNVWDNNKQKDLINKRNHFQNSMIEYFDLREKHPFVMEYDDKGFKSPMWIVKMCSDFSIEINKNRIDNGFDAIKISDVISKETYASGHSDYHSKFALYCAELCLIKENKTD
jgi:hypothetical protein